MLQGHPVKVFELRLCSLAFYCEEKQQQQEKSNHSTFAAARGNWLQFTSSSELQFTNHLCVAIGATPLVSSCQQLKEMFQSLSFALKKHGNRPGWDQGCSSCGMNNSSWFFFWRDGRGGIACGLFYFHGNKSFEILHNGAGLFSVQRQYMYIVILESISFSITRQGCIESGGHNNLLTENSLRTFFVL